MIKRYNNISLLLGVPGIAIQITGNILLFTTTLSPDLIVLFTLFGSILLLVGLGYYAKAKGRSELWCLWAFLGIIGFIVLACLKDESAPEASEICEEVTSTLPINPLPVDSPVPQQKFCPLAAWSLLLGIVSILTAFFTGIPAVICGLIALSQIRNSANNPSIVLTGRKKAITGIILGGLFSIVHALNLYFTTHPRH